METEQCASKMRKPSTAEDFLERRNSGGRKSPVGSVGPHPLLCQSRSLFSLHPRHLDLFVYYLLPTALLMFSGRSLRNVTFKPATQYTMEFLESGPCLRVRSPAQCLGKTWHLDHLTSCFGHLCRHLEWMYHILKLACA